MQQFEMQINSNEVNLQSDIYCVMTIPAQSEDENLIVSIDNKGDTQNPNGTTVAKNQITVTPTQIQLIASNYIQHVSQNPTIEKAQEGMQKLFILNGMIVNIKEAIKAKDRITIDKTNGKITIKEIKDDDNETPIITYLTNKSALNNSDVW